MQVYSEDRCCIDLCCRLPVLFVGMKEPKVVSNNVSHLVINMIQMTYFTKHDTLFLKREERMENSILFYQVIHKDTKQMMAM